MIYECVSVFDAAVNGFGRPVFVVAVGQAIRSFVDECQGAQPENPMRNHPEDFTLYHLGNFDDSSGAFVSFTQPLLLTRGAKNVS